MSIVKFVLLLQLASLALSQCPWNQQGLINWNTTSAGWTVPTQGANVVIDGIKVRLNVSPPRLNTIEIRNGGALVWGDVDNIELISNYIYVHDGGRFDIGSETCRFTKKAIITLTGRIDQGPTLPGFGKKFLGVGAGGTLELHGADPSPSWTQLAQTASSKPYINTQGRRGLNVAVFSGTDGEFLASQTFDTHNRSSNAVREFVNFIAALPNGRVVAIAVHDEGFNALNESAYQAAESIGSGRVRQLRFRGSWAIIGVKGAPIGSASEMVTNTTFGAATASRVFQNGQGQVTFTIDVLSAGWAETGGSRINITKLGNPTPILTLIRPVGWKAGDRVALASTDFSYRQAEEATLLPCPECAPNQVKLDSPLKYLHFGEIVDGVDERGEVALLTRSILIRGEMESSCYGDQPCQYFDFDTFGGHTKVIDNFANVHMDSVEFYQMGQQILGSYPVHFHMIGDLDQVGGYTNPTYVKNCAIHKSFSRCVTIHGSHGLLVKDNVGYDHLGHCYFLEDGIETRNTFDGNLGFVTKPSTILPSDRDTRMCLDITPYDFNGNPTSSGECNGISTFWITNPDNKLINNVAAGSHVTGFWYIFPNKPTGESKPFGTQIFPRYTPLDVFDNNRAHSNNDNGLMFDDGIKDTDPSSSAPQQILSMSSMRYRPREDPTNVNSPRKPARLYRYTAYKNRNRGVWVRGGDFRFYDARFADNAIGMTLASEGAMPNDPGSSQTIEGGIFVGETHNVGTPGFGITYQNGRTYPKSVNFPVRGFEFYDGPVSAKDVTFRKFYPTSQRNASAIGFLLSNNWQLSPWNNISNANFDDSLRVFVGGPHAWFNTLDGDMNPIFLDLDGTTTGVIGGSVVHTAPFFNTYRCVPRPQWNAQVCHEKFGQLFINNQNAGGTNFQGTNGGITFIRDERPDYSHRVIGIPNGDPRTQFQPLIIHGKTYTVHFPHPSPPRIRFQMTNWNAGDWIRVGVCYPASSSMSFQVQKQVGSRAAVQLTRVNSINDIDSDVNGTRFFFDNSTGLVFFKLVHLNDRIGDYYCGSQGCETVTIIATGTINNSGFCSGAYPKYAVDEYVPVNPGCVGGFDECGVCNGDGSSCQIPDESFESSSLSLHHYLPSLLFIFTSITTYLLF